jgi:glycosyltransferase involved in cell wall biosynthesis
MNQTKTLVSVIIPTANRPHLVVRSVQSALAQTIQNIEVIVVIDGPDEMTENIKQI